jgi:hypothetical protein
LDPFRVSGDSVCSESDVVYSIDKGGADFLSFDSSSRTLTCESSDLSVIGNYNISLIGTIVNVAQGDKTNSASFTLEIKSGQNPICTDEMVRIASQQTDLTYRINQGLQIT